MRNAKNKKYIAVYFGSLFLYFKPLFSLFAFHARAAFEQKVKGFCGFFMALIKHKIRMKYRKYIVNVSYFVVCFVKIFRKYPRNVKYEKCIAGLTSADCGKVTTCKNYCIMKLQCITFVCNIVPFHENCNMLVFPYM